jgi:DNA-binding transcriptional regulator YiaG
MTPLQIKHIRRSYGMSANTFALLTGCASGRTVRRWEAGENDVPKAVVNLLQVLGWIDPTARNSAINHILLCTNRSE